MEKVVKLMADRKLIKSNSEGRRLVHLQRVFVDDVKISDVDATADENSKIVVLKRNKNYSLCSCGEALVWADGMCKSCCEIEYGESPAKGA